MHDPFFEFVRRYGAAGPEFRFLFSRNLSHPLDRATVGRDVAAAHRANAFSRVHSFFLQANGTFTLSTQRCRRFATFTTSFVFG